MSRQAFCATVRTLRITLKAKDSQQGGLFQMEPEPGNMESDTLGPDFTYASQPPGEERLCFTNGRFA